MKYERRTDPRFVPASILICSSKCVALEIYNRLAELEDKIEDGTLVEVPKEVVVYTPNVGRRVYSAESRILLWRGGNSRPKNSLFQAVV